MQPSSVETVVVTKELAATWRDMQVYKRDRVLNENRMGVIRKAVEDGTFRTCIWAKARLDGVWYRINGKHTSNVFADYDKRLPPIKAHIETYHCSTPEELAVLYNTFDTRSSARNTSDINRAFAVTNPELEVLPPAVVNLCVAGMAFDHWEDRWSHDSAHGERTQLLMACPKFGVWANEILSVKEAKGVLNRSAVVAAMSRTFRRSQADADKFWKLVRDGTTANTRSVDRQLQRFLMTHSIGYGRGAATAKKTAGHKELFARCVTAWNLWRKGETTEIRYYADKKIPPAL